MNEARDRIGQQIRQLRKRLGITQEQLAKLSGFSAYQTISEIERGGRDVKAWEIARIADALRTDVRQLLSENPRRKVPVLWRDYPAEGAGVREAKFLQRCERYGDLEDLLALRPSRQLPQVPFDPKRATLAAAKRAAKQVAQSLDLGARPAASLTAVLEWDYLVKIWYDDLGKEGSAASAIGDFGCGILMHQAQAPWRRNFSFAHELFHLVTADCISPDQVAAEPRLHEKIEKLAQQFAASLLLPDDVLEVAFESKLRDGYITYVDLIEIAREFDVSTEALLWSLVNCRRLASEDAKKLLADQKFRELDRGTMAAHWCRPPLALPERYVQLAFRAYRLGKLSRARLAQFLETSLLDLPSRLAEYDLEETDDYQLEASAA